MNSLFRVFLYFALTATTLTHCAETKPTKFIEYHNRVILFNPFHQGYERIKPDAFYVGIDAFLAPVFAGDQGGLLDLNLRMGYNFFFNDRDHLTPFVGVGLIEYYRSHSHSGAAYGSLGFLYDHEFNSIFNLGLNATLMIGGPASRKHFNLGSPIIGTDISIPITFRFGPKRHWDFRIEPFNIYLHGSKATQDYFGFRNSLGYRF